MCDLERECPRSFVVTNTSYDRSRGTDITIVVVLDHVINTLFQLAIALLQSAIDVRETLACDSNGRFEEIAGVGTIRRSSPRISARIDIDRLNDDAELRCIATV